METRTSEILETALMLISEGISVIPLQARGKKPCSDLLPVGEDGKATWKTYQERIATEAEVRGWFDNTRGLNYGIVCGAVSGNLGALDFDDYSKAEEWSKKYGIVVAGCPIVKTGRESSGYHVYTRTTIPVNCGKGEFFEIKGEGGYVVGPGSTHPSGRLYELKRGDMAKIPVIDPALLGLEAAGGNGQGKPAGWQDEVLENDVREGERTTTLVSLVGRWIAHGLSRKEVERLASSVNAGWFPPLEDGVVLATIDGVFKTDSRKHGPSDTTGTIAGDSPGAEKKTIRFFSIPDIKSFPPIQYVIESYLPMGAVVNLSAYTGAGKSVLASSAAISAMSGLPFLGKFRVFKTGPVLYFDEETPRSFLQDRIEKMRFRDDDPFFLAHFTGLKLDRDKDFELILEEVRQRAPVLVVFDTLIRFHTADENSATEMAVVMGRLRKIANLGPCVLTQIHANKQTGDLRTRSRGSSDIIGDCDLELAITENDPKKNHGHLTLQSVKVRLAPVEPVTLRIQEVNGELSAILDDAVSSELTAALDEILEEAQGAISVTAMVKALEAQDVKVSRSTIYRYLDDKLEKTPGCFVVTAKGRAQFYALNREKQ